MQVQGFNSTCKGDARHDLIPLVPCIAIAECRVRSRSGYVSLVLATSGVALAQDPLPRKDILITEAWPAGTTFSNYNNLNPIALGNDLRNHAAFLYEPLFYWLNLTGEHVPYLATGLRVPDDVSVVGIDGLFLATLSNPKLTTVQLPIPEMARAMVERLMRPHADPYNDPRQVKFAPTGLIERESVAPPPAARRVRSPGRKPGKTVPSPGGRLTPP